MNPLKPAIIALLLATTTLAQTAPATPPSLDAYRTQLAARYTSSNPAAAEGTAPSPALRDLLRFLETAEGNGLPLDVITNQPNARARFRDDLAQQQKKREADLLLATGNTGLSPQDAAAEIDRLLATGDEMRRKVAAYTDQLDNLRLTLEIKKNKENAIQQKIATITAELQATIAHDEISLQLAKIADIQQNILDRTTEQQKIAIASAADVQAHAAELAAAKVRLFQRRDDLAATAAGGALPSLNRILIEVSIEIDEIQATVAAVSTRLTSAKGVARAREDLIALRLRAQTLAALEKLEAAMPAR